MVPLLYGSEISMLDFLGEVFTTYLVINPFKQKFFRVEKECTRLKNINKTLIKLFSMQPPPYISLS